MQEYLSVGCIVNTHGIRGELKVLPSTSDVDRFEYLYSFLVDTSPGSAGKGDRIAPDARTPLKEYKVESVRYHKNAVLLKLHGVDDMTSAEALKGREMWIPREEARELEEDEWFICDLIGMTVRENGFVLGTLTEVLETGSNDVYIVKDAQNREILIPALKDVILDVDLEAKLMEVKLPEGLLDEV